MDKTKIAKFIKKQKVAFICSVDENGFPNVKAMLRPRKINGLQQFYFSTNTQTASKQNFYASFCKVLQNYANPFAFPFPKTLKFVFGY